MESNESTEALRIVKSILKVKGEISCTDYGRYFIISTKKKICWICRVCLDNSMNTMCFPVDNYNGEACVQLKTLGDIYNYSKYITEAYNKAITF